MPGPLGRLEPSDWAHVERYPLRALAAAEQPKNQPVEVGFLWLSRYDEPVWDERARHWRVQAGPNASGVRGGHAFCFKPRGVVHPVSWWSFYDQGAPGAAEDPSGCVGFSLSQMQSLNNRRRYAGGWLYGQAKDIDEWPGRNYEGTSVRAGFEVLRTIGHARVIGRRTQLPAVSEGIERYRWITSAEEFATVLGYPGATHVPFVNTWGRQGYPHLTYFPVDEIDRQLRQWGGEAGVATDR